MKKLIFKSALSKGEVIERITNAAAGGMKNQGSEFSLDERPLGDAEIVSSHKDKHGESVADISYRFKVDEKEDGSEIVLERRKLTDRNYFLIAVGMLVFAVAFGYVNMLLINVIAGIIIGVLALGALTTSLVLSIVGDINLKYMTEWIEKTAKAKLVPDFKANRKKRLK